MSRLLHKHRFAEAESFAIQFGLDVEVIVPIYLFIEQAFLCAQDIGETVFLLQVAWCGVFIFQLVYKVKSNDILEKLALTSVDTSEQTKWQKLVDEAKENLHKIQVCFRCHVLECLDWWVGWSTLGRLTIVWHLWNRMMNLWWITAWRLSG